MFKRAQRNYPVLIIDGGSYAAPPLVVDYTDAATIYVDIQVSAAESAHFVDNLTAKLSNTFEGGTDEVDVTAGNSGGASGLAFGSKYDPGASNLVYDNARAARGAYSMRLDNNNAPAFLIWTPVETGGATSEIWGQAFIYVDSSFAGMRFAVGETAGVGGRWAVDITASRLIRLRDSVPTDTDSTGAIPLNAFVRVEFHVVHSTTTGFMEARAFLADSDVVITNTYVATAATLNTGPSANQYLFGQYLTNPTAFSVWFDDVELSYLTWPRLLEGIKIDITVSGTETYETPDAAEVYVDISASGVEFIERETLDSATVGVDISASGSELQEFVEAATVYYDIVPSGTDEQSSTILDSAEVYVNVSTSAADVQEFVEAASIYVDIQASGTDVAERTDAASVYVDIQVSAIELAEFIEVASVYVDIRPSGVELAESVEAASIYVDIQASGSDEHTTPAGTEYTESATILIDIQISAVEGLETTEAATIYVDIQVSATELAERADTATVLVDISTTGVEERVSEDSSTVYYDIQPSGSDIHEAATGYTDSATVYIDIQGTSVETAQLVDTGTIYVDISASTEDVYAALDNASIYYDISTSGTEGLESEYLDSATAYFDIRVSTVEILEAIDSSTISVAIAPSTVEVLATEDSSLVLIRITISSVDFHIVPNLNGVLFIVSSATRWYVAQVEFRWTFTAAQRWIYWAQANRRTAYAP